MAVTATRAGTRSLGSVYIALAALMWSLAGILQRQLHLNLASQIAGRAAFAILAIFVFVAVAERGRVRAAFRAIGTAGTGDRGAHGGLVRARSSPRSTTPRSRTS